MSVAGFLEALQSTVSIQLRVNVLVKVASLPGIALLKIMAWKDRGKATHGKDAIDLITICEQYQRAGNFERLFDEFSEQLEIYNDPDLVSAWMLGHDTALISGPKNARNVILIHIPSSFWRSTCQQAKKGKVILSISA
jgi:predicted nucleotidyltransferase